MVKIAEADDRLVVDPERSVSMTKRTALKTQKCPTCAGNGFIPESRYCGRCSEITHVAWKKCHQCKGTGVHLEHLLYTTLQFPIKETPKL